MLGGKPHADRSSERQPENMSFRNIQRLHEGGDIVGEVLGGVGALGTVRLAGSAEVERDAGEVLGVIGDLKGIASMVRGQVRNENQWLPGSLLVVIHGDVVGF